MTARYVGRLLSSPRGLHWRSSIKRLKRWFVTCHAWVSLECDEASAPTRSTELGQPLTRVFKQTNCCHYSIYTRGRGWWNGWLHQTDPWPRWPHDPWVVRCTGCIVLQLYLAYIYIYIYIYIYPPTSKYAFLGNMCRLYPFLYPCVWNVSTNEDRFRTPSFFWWSSCKY